MAVPRAVLVAGALTAVGVGIAAWALWPREGAMVTRMLARARSDGFEVALEQCRNQQTVEDIRRCVASDLFPDSAWPPPADASVWQKETWRVLDERIRNALGLPPRPQLAVLKV